MGTGMECWAYWGKSSQEGWHLLPYHCLDVAAVGQAYLCAHDRLREHLARATGLPEEMVVAWVGFFLALHDLGKFSQTFQGQREDIRKHLQPHIAPTRHGSVRHDTLGFVWWTRHLAAMVAGEEWLGPLGGDESETVEGALELWMQAATGHHGRPPQSGDGMTLQQAFTRDDDEAAMTFVRQARQLLLADVVPGTFDWRTLAAASRRLSWWLAGIAVLADWIGSNTHWFGYVSDPDFGLQRYWQRAQQQAIVALAESGVLPVDAARATDLTGLFPRIATPSPLQQECVGLALSDGPQLFLLEDVTGAGKTEAALLLAHRLMADDRADGIYFALPTMATAGAMYGRLEECHRRLFDPAADPSLVLAYAANRLDPRFQSSVLADPGTDLDGNDAGPPDTAGARCRAWLAESRKRALLAHIGAGTIDQALLAVLQARHQSLRLLGLFGKVLIVDEVHANDAYMHQLLQRLLTAHAAGGGNAILLSATLPANMRAGLVLAFRKGLGCADAVHGAIDAAYPLLTRIDSGPMALARPLHTRPQLRRRVGVRMVDDRSAVIGHLVATAADGHCGAWICNTVADARAAFRDLRHALCERGLAADRLSLFHSRFAMGDRRRIEDAVLDDFGTKDHGQRAGRLVVGTQVLQESLDLDFDAMVTDLAPIDLVIQRAGRLHRHVRDAGGALRSDGGADARDAPELWIHGPLPDTEARAGWYRDAFPIAAHVYPDHAALWRTAHWLQRGGFRMPEDARNMIESVFGEVDDRIEAPEALQRSAIRVQGERSAHASMATFNAIDFASGYCRGGNDWLDDAHTPTRLGADEIPLRVARWDGERWCPLVASDDGSWEWSTVKIRACHARERAPLADPPMEQAAQLAEASMPDHGRWSLLLPLTQVAASETWVGDIVDQRGERHRLFYSADMGLMREESDAG